MAAAPASAQKATRAEEIPFRAGVRHAVSGLPNRGAQNDRKISGATLARATRRIRRAAAALMAVSALTFAWGGPAKAAPCLEEAVAARVAEVVDARSLRLDDGRVLRLAGIEPFNLLRPDLDGAEAAMHRRIGALTEGGDVRMEAASEEPDRHGRVPALVAVGDSLVQEDLARGGLGIAFAGGDTLPCFDRILAAEAEARRERRGYWIYATLPPALPRALGPLIGRFAIFEGVVLTVGNRSATTYLNFGDFWSEDVTIEIAARDRVRFGGEAALGALVGRRIRARGYLEEKAGPMLGVRSPMQIELLDAPGASEAVAP